MEQTRPAVAGLDPPVSTPSGTVKCRNLASFVHKTTLPVPYLGSFCAIFVERTQLAFFITHSCLNRCAFFIWLRFAKSTLVESSLPTIRVEPSSPSPSYTFLSYPDSFTLSENPLVYFGRFGRFGSFFYCETLGAESDETRRMFAVGATWLDRLALEDVARTH